ncbi:hypothetical protein ID866_8153 [Astraeus odoratus]|nr:hypothetical protein ID866_8153 [Astraeus odoratus]
MHTSKKHHPLSKREFTNRINKLAKLFNLPNLKGHRLCIGGTLEYLLQRVPFDIIQSQGRAPQTEVDDEVELGEVFRPAHLSMS